MAITFSTAVGPSRVGGETRAAAHVRQHRSVLAASEKRLLIWIADRLPRRVSSDHLSALGLLSMLAVAASFHASQWWPSTALPLVPLFLILNWFGDSLDGTVARVRRQERPRYGYYVDHVIDMVGIVCLMAGIAASGAMSPWLAFAILVAFLLLSAECYLATFARGIFNMSFAGFGPTELRIVIAIGALKLMDSAWATLPWIGRVRVFDVGGGIALTGLVLTFATLVVRNTTALYREETTWR